MDICYLRGNELEPSELPPRLFVDDVLDFGVGLRQSLVQDLVLKRRACEMDRLLRAEITGYVVGRGCCGHCSANERGCGTKRMVGEERAEHPCVLAYDYGGLIFLLGPATGKTRVELRTPSVPLSADRAMRRRNNWP